MPIFTSDLTSSGIIYADTITTNSNEDLTLNPPGTGKVVISSDLIVDTINTSDSSALTLATSMNVNGTLQVTSALVGNVTMSGDMTITNDIFVNTSTSAVPVYSAEKPALANSLTSLSSDRVKFGTTSLRTGVNRAANHEAFTSNSFLNVIEDNEITDYMDDDANNDFTIELWFYDNTVLGSDPEASSSGNIIHLPSQFTISHSHDYSSPPVVGFSAGSGTTTTTTNTSSDEWHHAAIVNQSGTKTFYLDGSLVGSQTSSWPATANNIRLGNREDNRRRFNGFIDEFRISSTARYTSTFTPPTEAFTKDGDTLLLMHFDGDDGAQNQFLVESVNDTTTDAGVFVDGSASRLGVNNLTPTEAIDVVGTIKATTFSGTDLYLSGSAYLGGTGSANALDDYEEGTWTPTYSSETGSFGSITYDASVQGFYTKIGRMVHLMGFLRTDDVTVGTASSYLYLDGLPFTILNGYTAVGINTKGGTSDWGDNYPLTLEGVPNASKAFIGYRSTANSNQTLIQVSDMVTGDSADKNTLYFSITYQST
jgi:hypothetical protein